MVKRGLIGIAACLIAGWVILSALSKETRLNNQWDAELPPAATASAELFETLMKLGIVRLVASDPRFETDPCEALHDTGVGHVSDLDEPDVIRSLQRFCETRKGRDIAREITDWNGSFRLLGIRDNADRTPVCDDNRPIAGAVILTGCKQSRWTLARKVPGNSGETVGVVSVERAPPARTFAFLARSGEEFFSDWLLASQREFDGNNPDAALQLSTRIAGSSQGMRADLVGTPLGFEVNGQAVRFDADAERGGGTTVRAGGYAFTVRLVCDEPADGADCVGLRNEGAAHGYRIEFPPTGAQPVSFLVEAAFARNLPPAFLGLLRAGANDAPAPAILKSTDHLSVTCRKEATLVCEAQWVAPERPAGRRTAPYRVLTVEKDELVDVQGRTTSLAFELGLAAMVGFDRTDNGSLSAGLASAEREEPADFTLTINPVLQSIVQEELARQIASLSGNNTRLRDLMRGAVVFLDAGDDPDRRGEVLAAASVPQFVPNLHSWDIIALAEGGGSRNPLAGHAWRATDRYSTPGSTFKTVTGLSLIESGITNPQVQDLVLGRLSRQATNQAMGLDNGRLTIRDRGLPPYALRPTRTVSDTFLLPSGTGCPSARGGGEQAGLCEALAISSNHWFAGMNLMVNGHSAGRPGAGGNTDFALAVERLFPIVRPGDAADNRKAGTCVKCIDLAGGLAGRAERLKMEPINLPVASLPAALNINIGTNAYGQGVAASPMAMAAIYGSIASGKMLRPRILRDPEFGKPADEGEALFADQSGFISDGMENLRAGLKNVGAKHVESTLRDYRGQVFAKTGTGNSGAQGWEATYPISVSFSGWVEAGGRMPRRVSFVCWITHRPDSGASGAGDCAPVIRAILARLPQGFDLP